MRSMLAALRLRHRSNGVRVSRRVGIAIRAGDAARTRRDWPAAAAAYRAALDRNPALAHIWVQYGHALKEIGDTPAAFDAYRHAIQANPQAPDAALHLGHLARDTGAFAEAADAYLAAATLDPSRSEATFEYLRVRSPAATPRAIPDRDPRVTILETRLRIPDRAPAGLLPDPVPGELAYDITDLFAYLSRARIPTGIQRVQLEVLGDVLRRDDGRARRLLCFAPGRGGWLTIPVALFRPLLDAARHDGDDAAWRASLDGCLLAMVDGDPHRLAVDTTLVNLGTNWMDPAYLVAVRAARRNHGLRFTALVFDIIPVLRPDLFAETLARDFRRSIAQLVTTADGYVAISRTTAEDLRRFAAECGTPIDPHTMTVVSLDVDFRAVERRPAERSLAQFGMGERPYVLMVSTLEPRKNHLGAFAAWRRLAQTIGEARLPLLVCVGGSGWLNADIHAMLKATPSLRRTVRILSGVSDAELALLYTGCAFTLYPSLYEGWGLPVTESLCYGKVPAISNMASMPEAGGAFAVYFDPNDPAAIAASLTPLIVDPDRRRALETRIAADFHPRLWGAVADQIEAATRQTPPH